MADLEADHRAFARLVGLAHPRIHGVVAPRTSALDLFRDARDVAEQAVPGALGEAVAGVLAQAAHTRALTRMPGSLGASEIEMALALAVLDLAVTAPPASSDTTRED